MSCYHFPSQDASSCIIILLWSVTCLTIFPRACSLCTGRVIVMMWEFSRKPRNSNSCVGVRVLFIMLIINPRATNSSIAVARCLLASSLLPAMIVEVEDLPDSQLPQCGHHWFPGFGECSVSSRQQGGLHQPDVPCPKVRWLMVPSDNLKSLNRYVVIHHFKMESMRTVKGLMQKRGGCIPHHPLSPFTPKIPLVPMAGPDMAIQGPPLWTK